MYNKFKTLLNVAENFGKVVRAHLYDDYVNIEVIAKDGKKVTLSMNIEEEKKNDTV